MVLAEGPQGLDHLLKALTQADHQTRLGDDVVAAHLLGGGQHTVRALPGRSAAGDRVEARNHLDVVVEHVGTGVDDLGQRHLLTAEVRGEDLNPGLGRLAADLADDADEGVGAVVIHVVAIHRGDDRVAQTHAGDRAGHAGGLERVIPGRSARLDIAEATAPGAGVPRIMKVAVPRCQHSRYSDTPPPRTPCAGSPRGSGSAARGSVARRGRNLEPRRLAALIGLNLVGLDPDDRQDVADAAGIRT